MWRIAHFQEKSVILHTQHWQWFYFRRQLPGEFEFATDTVTVGGIVVRPGDLLHADRRGVLMVPAEIARELPTAIRAVEA